MPSLLSPAYPELTRKIVAQAHPRAILQVGAGALETTLALCEAMTADESALLTLVDPDLHTDPACRALLDALDHHELDTAVELISNPADQALPDFFFQEQVYDMAVLNPLSRADQNFVALYYIGKLLPRGALLLIHDAENEAVKPWLRQLVQNGEYKVRRASAVENTQPLLEKLLRSRYQKLPAFVRSRIEDMIRPEMIKPNSELGLDADFLVLEKLSQGCAVDLDVEQMIAELV